MCATALMATVLLRWLSSSDRSAARRRNCVPRSLPPRRTATPDTGCRSWRCLRPSSCRSRDKHCPRTGNTTRSGRHRQSARCCPNSIYPARRATNRGGSSAGFPSAAGLSDSRARRHVQLGPELDASCRVRRGAKRRSHALRLRQPERLRHVTTKTSPSSKRFRYMGTAPDFSMT